MGGGSKEDAYTCDHLEKFELATFSSRVDVEIFLFWGGNVDQPIFFAKSKKVVERCLMVIFLFANENSRNVCP